MFIKILFILAVVTIFSCSSKKGKHDPLVSSKAEAIAIENHVKLLREKNGCEPSPIELRDYIEQTKAGSRWLEFWTFYPNDGQVMALKRDVIDMHGDRVDVILMKSGEILVTK